MLRSGGLFRTCIYIMLSGFTSMAAAGQDLEENSNTSAIDCRESVSLQVPLSAHTAPDEAKFKKISELLAKKLVEFNKETTDEMFAKEQQIEVLQQRLVEKIEELKSERKSNIGLNDDLRICQAQHAKDVLLQESLREMQKQIIDSANEIQRHERAENELRNLVRKYDERLTELGYSLEASFSYFRNSPFESFLRFSDLSKLKPGDVALSFDFCAAALNWLESQDGPSTALRQMVWVFEDSNTVLCTENADGAIVRLTPRRSDEAHLLIYR